MMKRIMLAQWWLPTEKILAFVGIGDEHHIPNTPISSQSTLTSMEQNDIIYLDGKENPYQCSLSQDCKLGSALIIPLRAGNEVVGTTVVWTKAKVAPTINMSMGGGCKYRSAIVESDPIQ